MPSWGSWQVTMNSFLPLDTMVLRRVWQHCHWTFHRAWDQASSTSRTHSHVCGKWAFLTKLFSKAQYQHCNDYSIDLFPFFFFSNRLLSSSFLCGKISFLGGGWVGGCGGCLTWVIQYLIQVWHTNWANCDKVKAFTLEEDVSTILTLIFSLSSVQGDPSSW